MNREEQTIIAEAAAWHAASENDDMDWDGFTLWLEASPDHRAAYDQVGMSDLMVTDHSRSLFETEAADSAATRPHSRRPRSWIRWGGLAIAASLLVVLVTNQIAAPAPQIYETGATSQKIALEDGSTIELAPRSRLTVSGRDQEALALTGGGYFDIAHDPDRRMTISIGGLSISDIGTQFDIQSQDGLVRVEVGEGEVSVSSAALSRAIRLVAGKSLDYDSVQGSAVVSPVAADDIGEWRSGRLSYNSVPLSLVASELSRYAGVSIMVPGELRDRRFSGTLTVGDGEAAIRDLSQVMGLELGRTGSGYRLELPGS